MIIYNIEAEEACDYTMTFNLVDDITGLPTNLTGYTGVFTVNRNYDGYPAPSPDFVINASTSATIGSVALGGTAGTVTVSLTASALTNLTWNNAVFDVILTSSTGAKSKAVKGFFTILPSIS